MAMVKQDLSEFMCTVQNDTTSAIADTATVVKDQLKVVDLFLKILDEYWVIVLPQFWGENGGRAQILRLIEWQFIATAWPVAF